MDERKPIAPSLSRAGWVLDPPNLLSYAFAWVLSANKTQTVLHRNHTFSLPEMVANKSGASLIIAEVSDQLERYFTDYFPAGVSVEVSEDAAASDDSVLTLSIFVEVVTSTGAKLKLQEALSMNLGPAGKVINIYNRGDV